ncbi:hypothetical protein GCM10010412_026490 [Nonomuraea recticatena]|uniref:DUF397 domain-containing protein n=1 Tax=Nonomuraea recticatena TaxID=46178 RepID=A0ABN3RMM5_9ACTN
MMARGRVIAASSGWEAQHGGGADGRELPNEVLWIKSGDPRRGGERGSPDRSGSGGVEPGPFQKKAFIT